jgi:hypothetical protein
VERGLFAYALGDGETFDTIYYQEPRLSGQFEIIEGAWLLRPALAEELLRVEEEEKTFPEPEPEPEVDGKEPEDTEPTSPGPGSTSPTPPPPPPQTYSRVVIDTPVDWQQWYEFYQAVIEPLIEGGAEVAMRLHLEAQGELDANLIDLSVRESVTQFNLQGKVKTEE